MATTAYSADTMAIDICPHCGKDLYGPGNFCTACGNNITPPHNKPLASNVPYHTAARGFGQMFGTHPIPATATVAANVMLFGGTLATAGAILPLAVIVGIVLSFVTYRAQMKWYGDDSESAALKAIIIGLLTSIPVGLPAFLTVPSGIIGAVHMLRRKS